MQFSYNTIYRRSVTSLPHPGKLVTMGSNKTAFWAFVAAAIVYALSLFLFAQALPDRVASHFGNNGLANGWMSRQEYVIFTLFMGLGAPLAVCLLTFLVRYFPSSLLNVPHPEYWRSPEHYPEACRYLFESSFWFGAAMLLWMAGMNYLTLQANAITPPRLDETQVWMLTGGFLVVIAGWIVLLVRHYKQVPPPPATTPSL